MCTLTNTLRILEFIYNEEENMEEKFIDGQTSEIKTILDYLNRIKQLLRYTKGKDDIIAQLGKDLQHYRDGFTVWAFKPFILAVIDFRESCKKDVQSLSKYSYDVEKIKKNLGYLSDDLTELLIQNGIEEKDSEYYYNGHNIAMPLEFNSEETRADMLLCNLEGEETTIPDTANGEETAHAEENQKTLAEILEEYQNEFVSLLNNNNALEASYLSLVKSSAKVDANNKLLFIYPVLKRLIQLKTDIGVKLENLSENDDEAKYNYEILLKYIVAELESMLGLLGCTVLVTDDVFNTTQHRLLKSVATDDETLDRSICTKLTDAYTFEEKVIFPQKVEVYKFKK